jgi:aminopeptidase YwaD
LLAFLLVACSGDSEDVSPAATATPQASPAAEGSLPAPVPNAAAATPDGERILGDVRHLTETIGPRAAGTATEQAAAEFIAERLRSLGYDVRLQEFPAGSEAARASSLSVVSPAADTVPALPFERSASGTVRGTLVAGGLGAPSQLPSQIRGSIVLIERGDLLFSEKVGNAQAAGARAAIIYNNEAGTFFGTLQDQSAIPAVSISQAAGQSLLSRLRSGPVEIELIVGSLSEAVSRNVFAKPPNHDCDTISGGHYDSVPQAPGASDNATGTATVLEIASVLSRNGQMAGHCFVLFGAEEVGLVGSRAFVNSFDSAARQRLKAMLNFDMVGVGDEGWVLIGSANLQEMAARLAGDLGINVTRGSLPITTSSDHASFISAGVPALMIHRTEDRLLHTPQDVAGRVEPELLEEAARIGVALLNTLSAGG